MRAFFAILLSEETRKNLGQCRDDLKASFDNVKWVENENFHVTLSFLGEIDQRMVDLLIKGIQQVSGEITPFEMNLFGLGAFPGLAKPRVIWAGIREGSEEIKSVYREVDKFLRTLGFTEDKKFSPHVTIGRVRSQLDSQGLVSCSKKVGELGREKVQGISLMESALTSKGPVYSEIAYFKFRK